MNETLRSQQSHRSIRSYKSDSISEEMLNNIIATAHQAPTSMNAQEISLIVVRDTERKAKIAELAGSQPWIAQAPVFITIVIDFHKTDLGVRKAGETQIIQESMEGFGVAAVDAGIVLGTMMTAAESLGLGVVPIGGIRRNPQGMIDLLALPPLTFPLVGLVIGHIDKNAPQKPRLALNTFRHEERYDDSHYADAIDSYDEEILDYWQRLNRADGVTWSNNLGASLKQVYFPHVRPVAAMQGLLNDK